MKDRVLLLLYGAAVVVATLIHRASLLGALLAVALVLSGKRWRSLLRRSLVAVALFSSAVLLAYAAFSLHDGTFEPGYVVLVALRVLTLTYVTMLLAERVNLFRAFSFSKELLYVVTLATSQVLTMRRTMHEFREALRSRNLERPAIADVHRHGAATAAFFVHKAAGDAREIAQAMKSRGFFDDQG